MRGYWPGLLTQHFTFQSGSQRFRLIFCKPYIFLPFFAVVFKTVSYLMLPLFPSFKKYLLNIFCWELRKKKKNQLSPSQKLPKAKSTWELKLKPLTAGLPNHRGLFQPKWFHDCNIRKGEYSAHSMVFYLCHCFLLASTGYSTISSLSSQKLLVVELKLDSVLTPGLGRKKKNLPSTTILSYSPSTSGQMSWNWYSRTPTQKGHT